MKLRMTIFAACAATLMAAHAQTLTIPTGGNDAAVILEQGSFNVNGSFIGGTGGNTKIQVEAIADSVREYVQEKTGQKPFNYDGYQNSQWIVIDYGTVFAHILLPEERERYNLEELWADANIHHIPNLD